MYFFLLFFLLKIKNEMMQEQKTAMKTGIDSWHIVRDGVQEGVQRQLINKKCP